MPDNELTQNMEISLHQEGAILLVAGNLLARGVHANKAHTSYPGWDVFALNFNSNKPARIQVRTSVQDDPLISDVDYFDFDFIVLVWLCQSGSSNNKSELIEEAPKFWIIPREDLENLTGDLKGINVSTSKSFSLAQLPRSPDFYINNWQSILDFLDR